MSLFHNFSSDPKLCSYIIVNNNYIVDSESSIRDFSEFDINKVRESKYSMDFIETSNKNLLIYFSFPSRNMFPRAGNKTFFFMKNKIYKFGDRFEDEIGTIMHYDDIWYDPFLFVSEKDYNQATRYLKLKKLNNA